MWQNTNYEQSAEQMFNAAWDEIKFHQPTAIMFKAFLDEKHSDLAETLGWRHSVIDWTDKTVLVAYKPDCSVAFSYYEFALPDDFLLS